MANFPSVLNTFTRPTASDRLNNPSHSALHNTVSSALGQVEAVIGVDGASSVVGTMMYDLRSPASGGGGHVQTANKGGTGQTTYNKGDILVAQSSSVLTKLAAGNNREVLTVTPGANTGISWSSVSSTNKVGVTTSIRGYALSGSVSTVLYAASVAGSTLGTNNAIRFEGSFSRFMSSNEQYIYLTYGDNVISSVSSISPSVLADSQGIVTLSGVIAGDSATNAQKGYLVFTVNASPGALVTQTRAKSGSSSVESSADQELKLTLTLPSGAHASVITGIFTADRIF